VTPRDQLITLSTGWLTTVAASAALLTVPLGCHEARRSSQPSVAEVQCDAQNPDLHHAAFVIVTRPVAGQRVSSPIHVSGCSSTFESNVLWVLRGRDGGTLGSGYTGGGNLGAPAPFTFEVAFSVETSEIGHLEVFERDESEGEGYPPGKTVLPLVLLP